MSVLIRWSATPNPDALRFELPEELPVHAPLAVRPGGAVIPPLAARLLAIEGVAHCLIARDFIAVTRSGRRHDWADLRPEILFSLAESLDQSDELRALAALGPSAAAPIDDRVEIQIQELLAKRIAPAVAQDGGAIAFVSFVDGVVTVRLSGACGGCPSALMTLKRGVETTLMRYVPEVRRVVAEREKPEAPGEPFWKTMLRGRGGRFRKDGQASG